MKENLSQFDQSVLKILPRVRGILSHTALKYAALSKAKTAEAVRKGFERLEQKGFLSKSKLPASSQIFHLSNKGVQLTGAPSSFADSPTQNTAYDMIAASSCGWKKDEFVFLTRDEFVSLCTRLYPEFNLGKTPGRFLLRRVSIPTNQGKSVVSEFHLHYWLAEFKPAEQLANRIQVIAQKLAATNAFFETATRHRVFGITVAVPSAGVSTTLLQHSFSVEVSCVVVEELMVTFAKPLSQ